MGESGLEDGMKIKNGLKSFFKNYSIHFVCYTFKPSLVFSFAFFSAQSLHTPYNSMR